MRKTMLGLVAVLAMCCVSMAVSAQEATPDVIQDDVQCGTQCEMQDAFRVVAAIPVTPAQAGLNQALATPLPGGATLEADDLAGLPIDPSAMALSPVLLAFVLAALTAACVELLKGASARFNSLSGAAKAASAALIGTMFGALVAAFAPVPWSWWISLLCGFGGGGGFTLVRTIGKAGQARQESDPAIPAAPRRLRRQLARDLANSVTRTGNLLLLAGIIAILAACGALSQDTKTRLTVDGLNLASCAEQCGAAGLSGTIQHYANGSQSLSGIGDSVAVCLEVCASQQGVVMVMDLVTGLIVDLANRPKALLRPGEAPHTYKVILKPRPVAE
jgi:hypothetical protein